MSDAAIRRLAERQRGYVARRQLVARGYSRQAIAHRRSSGLLIDTPYRGVYAVGHVPTLPQDRAMAALLACGEGAVLSHSSAASLWSIARRWRAPYEVTVPGDRRPTLIEVHRARLAAPDMTTQRGLRVTSPARTVLDISPGNERPLARVVNELYVAGWLRRAALLDVVSRFPRHPGARLVRAILFDERGPSRSELEDALRVLLTGPDFAPVRFEVPMGGRILDALFPAERVIVEVDGWIWHRTHTAFREDRTRDLDHAAIGYLTVRLTWEDVILSPARTALRLQGVLARRRRGLGL